MLPRANQSTGCYRCRKMKVKCDEQKPECQRCTKVKRKCPGYRPESGRLQFRSMNSWAASKVTDSDISQEQNAETITLTTIRPSTPWEQVATTRFVENFTIPTTRGWTGYLEYLPELLVSPPEPLHEALLAVSFAHFGNISCMPTLTKKSEIHHDKALRALSSALGDPRAPAQDETLATVMLLQKFEIISGTGQLSHSPHDEGAAEIIRQRQASPPASHIGKVLMQNVVTKQVIQAVCNGISPNLEAGYVTIQKTVLGTLLWPLLRDVSICRSKIETAIAQVTFTPTQHGALKVALQEAMLTFNRLHHWPQNVPTQLRYKIAQSGEDGQLDFSTRNPSERTFVFLRIQHGTLWMLYWLSCIHITQAMKNGYNVINRYLPTNNESKHLMDIFYERLVESTANIISCAPFLMGDIDEQGNLKIGETGKTLGAFFLLRGLVTAISVAEISPSQKQTILAYLERIGSAFGIKKALVARNRHYLASGAMTTLQNVQ